MSKDFEPASAGTLLKSGYVCVLGAHRLTLLKLGGRFSRLSVFLKEGLLRILENSQFICYRDESHVKT